MDTPEQARLLVVEDDLIVRALLGKRLRTAGYAVEAARDGQEGLELAREVHPDLILTDWMMPGMDGAALLAALRADSVLHLSYVIVLTSKDDHKDRIAGLELGADAYLVKPWEDEALLACVRAGVRIQRLQRELASAEHRAALLPVAARLGHEINNPLTVLSATLEMARYSPPTGSDLMQLLERSQGQVDRIAKLVSSIRQLDGPLVAATCGQPTRPDLPLQTAGRVGSAQ